MQHRAQQEEEGEEEVENHPGNDSHEGGCLVALQERKIRDNDPRNLKYFQFSVLRRWRDFLSSPTHLFISGLVSKPVCELAEYEVVEVGVDHQVDGGQEDGEAAED